MVRRLSVSARLLAPLALIALTGCAVREALLIPPDQRCGPEAEATLAAADFSRLRVIDIKVSEGEFSPMVIRLREGRPYTFRIENTDNEDRLFAAPVFFLTTAVGDLKFGDRATHAVCLDRLAIPAFETTSVTLIPLRAGAYDLEDAFVLPSGGVGIGTIRVEPAFMGLADTGTSEMF